MPYSRKESEKRPEEKTSNPYEAYLSKISFDDIPSALSLSFSQLRRLNRDLIDFETRLNYFRPFFSCYRRFFRYFHPARDQAHYQWQLKESDYKALADYANEMHIGSKLLVKELPPDSTEKNEQAHFIYLAIYFLGHCILFNYERSYWVPESIWRQLHKLYSFAERRRLLNIQHRNPIDDSEYNTIRKLYSKICITATADPYRLGKGEIWVIFDYCQHVSALIEIQPPIDATAKTDSGAEWVIDLNSTNRPRARYLIESQLKQTPTSYNHKYIRHFSMKIVRDEIEQHISILESGGSIVTTGVELPYSTELIHSALSNLSLSWQESARHAERQDLEEGVKLIWGLQNIAEMLRVQQGIGSPDEAELNRHQITEATLKNLTDGGFGITLPKNYKEHFGIGDLVAVIRQDAQFALLGTLQWTAVDKKNDLNGGVKIVEGNPEPVIIGHREINGYERSVIFLQPPSDSNYPDEIDGDFAGNDADLPTTKPAEPTTDETTAENSDGGKTDEGSEQAQQSKLLFIAHNKLYEVDEHLTLQLPGVLEQYEIRVTHVTESTKRVTQYQFEIIQPLT